MADASEAETPHLSAVAPVTKSARIVPLDVLRGIAVLGILMMNITAFGLLFQAYDNPLVEGGATGLNLTVYKIINLGFEGTMRGIFSLLFGASLVLLTGRMEQAGAGLMAAEVHFRRMGWMMLFGVIHWALLLWTGEILFLYSLCGFLLFSFRKLSPKVHLIMAAVLLVGAAAFVSAGAAGVVETRAAAMAAQQAKAEGTQITRQQEKAIEAWREEVSHIMPTPEEAAEQRRWHSGSYWNAVTGQLPGSFAFQWVGAPFFVFFDVVPFMLIGMALLKLGVLSATRPAKTYALMALGGYAIGLPLGLFELDTILSGNFSRVAFAYASRTYELSRLAMVVGHLGVLLLFIRSGSLAGMQKALAAVGQMALSNYLAQTLICTMLFYGFGFALFGQLERWQLYLVVAAIWAVELAWSPLWLAHFRFGPFEWLWRSLTYWQRQPMRLAPIDTRGNGTVAAVG